ncbi:MAG TPA: HAMP domain-containing protein, partial [Kofleriaceae bacterium]
MRLHRHLLAASTTVLVVFGAASALAYVSFRYTALPMFAGLLHQKAGQLARSAATELDVGLGTGDRTLMDKELEAIERDPDFSAIVVRDARDRIVASHGDAAEGLFVRAPYLAYELGGQVSAWVPVTLEGMKLGSVSVVLSSARLDSLGRGAERLALVVFAIWLFILVNSITFARRFVSPIFAMMEFTRKVAGGALAERLTAPAPGELEQLRDYLNEMTADLKHHKTKQQTTQLKTITIQHKILSLSRMAGMAEIASGVLHNVGNVLNSLN